MDSKKTAWAVQGLHPDAETPILVMKKMRKCLAHTCIACIDAAASHGHFMDVGMGGVRNPRHMHEALGVRMRKICVGVWYCTLQKTPILENARTLAPNKTTWGNVQTLSLIHI